VNKNLTGRIAAAIALLALCVSCSDNGDAGGGSPIAPSGGSPGPSGATVTIGSNGVISPTQVSVSTGQSVTFINNDSRSHEMASDPHPTHTNCPPINALGVLAAGQTKLTNAFAAGGSCGFHDHNDPNNTNLRGSITIR
jgi:plastocyanin